MSATTTTPDQQAFSPEDASSGLRRDLGRTGLLFAGIGSIIGSGWLFGAFKAAGIAGPSAVLSWAIGAVMILLIGLTYAELGPMFPVSGGVVRYPHYSFGSATSFVLGWITWLAAASVAPVEVEAALNYASNNVGGLAHLSAAAGKNPVLTFPLGYIVAALLMAFFVWLNFRGIRWFAKFNNPIVTWKLLIIVLVIVAFLATKFQSSNFNAFGGFAPGGVHGIFEAIATAGITFSFLGFRQGIELAGETDNPSRNIPFAIIGSVLGCGVIYILLQVAFIGAAPVGGKHGLAAVGWTNLSFTDDFGPLAGIAKLIGLSWLATVLYVDAVVSPGDTGLIYTTVTARISYAMARNRNVPSTFERTSSEGAPTSGLILAFVVGLIFFLPFPGWQKLIEFITSATVLSFGAGPLVLAAMRRQLPDMERKFRLPGGHIIPFLAFFSSNMIVYWAGWDTNYKLYLAIVLGLLLYGANVVFGRERLPRLELRSALFLVPWLGGLCVMSYLGNYPEKAMGAGNLAVFGTSSLALVWAALVILAISLLSYVLAIALRLPSDRVAQQIEGAAPIESRR
ncbi:MAG: APC family permease [Solirubrobacteraceae bacterium]